MKWAMRIAVYVADELGEDLINIYSDLGDNILANNQLINLGVKLFAIPNSDEKQLSELKTMSDFTGLSEKDFVMDSEIDSECIYFLLETNAGPYDEVNDGLWELFPDLSQNLENHVTLFGYVCPEPRTVGDILNLVRQAYSSGEFDTGYFNCDDQLDYIRSLSDLPKSVSKALELD